MENIKPLIIWSFRLLHDIFLCLFTEICLLAFQNPQHSNNVQFRARRRRNTIYLEQEAITFVDHRRAANKGAQLASTFFSLSKVVHLKNFYSFRFSLLIFHFSTLTHFHSLQIPNSIPISSRRAHASFCHICPPNFHFMSKREHSALVDEEEEMKNQKQDEEMWKIRMSCEGWKEKIQRTDSRMNWEYEHMTIIHSTPHVIYWISRMFFGDSTRWEQYDMLRFSLNLSSMRKLLIVIDTDLLQNRRSIQTRRQSIDDVLKARAALSHVSYFYFFSSHINTQ